MQLEIVKGPHFSIDANNRPNPLLDRPRAKNSEIVQRVVNVALPFLCLYQPIGMVANVALGAEKCWRNLTDIRLSYQKGNWLQIGKDVGLIAFTVATVALTILMPNVGIVLTQGVQLVLDINQLRLAIKHQQYAEIAKTIFGMARSVVYITSVLCAAPEILIISLLAQAAFELYQSVGEFKQGRYLETAAKIAMAAIRCYQAAPHVVTLERNYLGKQMSQEDFLSVINEAKATNRTIETVLKAKHYSSHVNHITIREKKFEGLVFDNLRFRNCHFNDIFVKHCTFSNVKFTKCEVNNFRVFQSLFQRCVFEDTRLINTIFFNSFLINNWFKFCDLTYSCFNDSKIYQTHYIGSKMLETNFLGAEVKASTIVGSDLTDCLLVETEKDFTIIGGTPHKITRPVVALAWNFENYEKIVMGRVINEALKDHKVIPLRFDYCPRDIDPDLLDHEVKTLLNEIKSENREILSIPAEILKRAQSGSEIDKMSQIARKICTHAEGLLLPGGLNVQSEFYGDDPQKGTTDPDYRRTILEFAIVKEVDRLQLPTMGICRGAQLVNVFFGGTLTQGMPDHNGIHHILKVNENVPDHLKKIMDEMVGDGVYGLSRHFQACNDIGKGLHVVMEENGSPEALMSENTRFMLTQFHPEAYQLHQLLGDKDDFDLADFKRDFSGETYKPFKTGVKPEVTRNSNFFRRFAAQSQAQLEREENAQPSKKQENSLSELFASLSKLADIAFFYKKDNQVYFLKRKELLKA